MKTAARGFSLGPAGDRDGHPSLSANQAAGLFFRERASGFGAALLATVGGEVESVGAGFGDNRRHGFLTAGACNGRK
jgi:hypothetical protein